MRLLVVFVLAVCWTGRAAGMVFSKCGLAEALEKNYNMPRQDVKHWVCIAQYESTFNSSAINHFNWDGSKDYGLFQLNNKYWCDDHYNKNHCGIPCSNLLDDDLTDDLQCIKKIIRDTEQWKGKGTGLTAWVAYVKRCQHRNLDEYMSECRSSASNLVDTVNPASPHSLDTSPPAAGGTAAAGDEAIINNARVPISRQKVISNMHPPSSYLYSHLPLHVIPSPYYFFYR